MYFTLYRLETGEPDGLQPPVPTELVSGTIEGILEQELYDQMLEP